MAEFATGTPVPRAENGAAPARLWYLADAQARHFAIAIYRHGQRHWDKPTGDKGHVVVVLCASVADAHLAKLAATGVSYLVMPDDDIDLGAMLAELGEHLGIKRVLLEGGATMNGAFLNTGLFDEVSVMMCPAIDGSTGKPGIFEAGEDGVKHPPKLELLSATPGVHNTVHLRYRLVKN
jgi:riboflavin biosynthesis pyrimidine reductase